MRSDITSLSRTYVDTALEDVVLSTLCTVCEFVIYRTSVSETIRKAPLVEAQTILGKQNTFCGTWVSVPVPKFCEKTASTRKISLKSGNQSAAELWPKKRPPS